jgi:hypothetical protein
MELSDELRATFFLIPRKLPMVAIGFEAGWDPVTALAVWRRKKSILADIEPRFIGIPTHKLITVVIDISIASVV